MQGSFSLEVYGVKENDLIKQLKQTIQTCIKNKSVTVSRDGTVKIVQRYKPNENLVFSTKSRDDEFMLLKWIEAITSIKYKCISLQNEPSCCYNTYVRIVNISSAHSKDRVKRFFRYFDKLENGSFIKKSYAEVIFIFKPLNKDQFKEIKL